MPLPPHRHRRRQRRIWRRTSRPRRCRARAFPSSSMGRPRPAERREGGACRRRIRTRPKTTTAFGGMTPPFPPPPPPSPSPPPPPPHRRRRRRRSDGGVRVERDHRHGVGVSVHSQPSHHPPIAGDDGRRCDLREDGGVGEGRFPCPDDGGGEDARRCRRMGPGRDVDVAMVIVVAGRGGGRWQARLRRRRTPSIIRRCHRPRRGRGIPPPLPTPKNSIFKCNVCSESYVCGKLPYFKKKYMRRNKYTIG